MIVIKRRVMNNPILLSEGFERAVSQFSRTVQEILQFDPQQLRQIVYDFEIRVTRLRDIIGMQAENM